MQKVIQFLREVKEEFGHITWPKKEALFDLTIVVISISIFISLILGGFDYLFTQSLSLLGQQPIQQSTQTNPESTSSAFIITPASGTPVITPITTQTPTIKTK